MVYVKDKTFSFSIDIAYNIINLYAKFPYD